MLVRNGLGQIKEENELNNSIFEYKNWDEEMLKALALISPGEASWLKTLDRMPVVSGNFINTEHKLYVQVMNEKLTRLDMIIRKHLDLPQKKQRG